VEGDRHNSVGVVKGLFDSIAVMDIDVQVQNSGIDSE
jgi:hypothetical protein